MTNNLPNLYDMIANIIISIFIPVIVVVGLKYTEKEKRNKILKILTIVFFLMEAYRFFYNAHFYPKAMVESKDLKIGFITFMSIMVLFSTFIENLKVKTFLRKGFILLSLIPFVIGLLGDRGYNSAYDTYSLLKGFFFIESGLTIAIAVIYLVEDNYQISFIDCLTFFGIALISVFVAIFYNFIWNLEIQYNAIWWVQKIAYSLSPFIVYLIISILRKITCQKKHF